VTFFQINNVITHIICNHSLYKVLLALSCKTPTETMEVLSHSRITHVCSRLYQKTEQPMTSNFNFCLRELSILIRHAMFSRDQFCGTGIIIWYACEVIKYLIYLKLTAW
jgi:hypothetical protein